MEIYYIDIDNFFKNTDISSFETFISAFSEGRKFGSAKRQKEFSVGRFLLKYVLKNRFHTQSPEIVVENKKPRLKNFCADSVKFSLTHSKGIVMAAFSDTDIGIDLEFMRERNFEKLFAYYKLHPQNCCKKTFYQLWTEYEARIKLQKKANAVLSAVFQKDYSLSVCTEGEWDISKTLKIYELKSPAHSTNPSELINLKLVKDNRKKENALVAQEISTADSEFEFLSPLNLKIE